MCSSWASSSCLKKKKIDVANQLWVCKDFLSSLSFFTQFDSSQYIFPHLCWWAWQEEVATVAREPLSSDIVQHPEVKMRIVDSNNGFLSWKVSSQLRGGLNQDVYNDTRDITSPTQLSYTTPYFNCKDHIKSKLYRQLLFPCVSLLDNTLLKINIHPNKEKKNLFCVQNK